MVSELARAIDQIVKDKGISREALIDASEKSILAAARKMLGPSTDIEAQFNEELGEVELFEFKTVVAELEDDETEIQLDEARELDPGAEPGDSLGIKMDLEGFGRIAAQTAKQVLLQHVRDAERDYIFNEYKDRKDELITGVVRRFEKGSLIVDLGKAEAMLPPREQVQTESYRPGDRIQAFVLDVLRTTRGPQIILSRTHPGLIRKLFEMEVPEIFEGIVRIEAVAREPGYRAKIAVASRDSDVDPVGACVGMKGSRVQAVVQELRGEKIDIIPWSVDPAKFVCNAIAPAAVTKVIIDEETRSMELVVPDDQLSLAIGRRGQNVRLAAQLTGWRIDIISESKIQEMNARARAELQRIDGLSDTLVEILVRHGYRATNDVASAEPEELIEFLGLDTERATHVIERAQELLDVPLEEPIGDAAGEEEIAEGELASSNETVEDAEAATETADEEQVSPTSEDATDTVEDEAEAAQEPATTELTEESEASADDESQSSTASHDTDPADSMDEAQAGDDAPTDESDSQPSESAEEMVEG